MKRIFDHFYGLIGRMTPSQIVFVAIIFVGIIVGTVMIVGWAKSQYFVPLYTNLSSEDAGKIIDRLKDMHVQYQIGDNGGSISVPTDDVYETRMKLATAGLPSPQNIGYALFDQSNIGMTDFLQKVNYRRALEGELAKTITGLSEVAAARVHLVIPEDRLFKEDQHSPTASVVLKLRGTGGLSKKQLQGITYLVASAIEGMKPDNVTVIDYDGNLLTGTQMTDESAMLSSNQFDMRKNVESYLEQKAQTMLGGVVGQGHAIVRVTAELNFEKNSTQIEEYNPDQIAVRSEQRTSQKGNQAEGNAGTPPTPASTASDNAEDVITNYEVSKTIKSIIGEVGSIKRLTVAVIVDGNYQDKKTPEGDVSHEYISRTPEELNRFAAITKNAVGFSDSRSDKFEIVNVPFDNSLLETSKKDLDTSDKVTNYIFYGKKIGLLAIALVAFFYVKKKVSRVISAVAKYVPPPPPPLSIPEPEIVQKPQKPRLIDSMKMQTKGKNEEIAKVIKTIMSENG